MSAAETENPTPWPTPPTTQPSNPSTQPPAQDPQAEEGPLRTLAHKAVSTGLVRRARQGVPSFAEPAVSRTATTADAVLTHVDDGLVAAQRTMATDEGKALRDAACKFGNALYVFVAMLAMVALQRAETLFHIKYEQPDGQLPSAPARVGKVVKVAGEKVRSKFEKRENEVAGTREADLYKKARSLGAAAIGVVTCVTNALAKYSGPASEYVVPMAERAMSVLPDVPTSRCDSSDLSVTPPSPDHPTEANESAPTS